MYYTKYRPKKFSEISKPNDAAQALSEQLKKGTSVHAYLFVGSRGTGKTTTARILAKALNCASINKEGDPCGKCKNCKEFENSSYVDLIEIDAASNRGIDDIRSLKEKIHLSPVMGKRKVYIIDEVHMLTNEAFNALLKTLEEPPEHAVFILCTTEFHKVPETIKSRCQVYKFKRATRSQLVTKLKNICDAEGVTTLTNQDLALIADSAHGGFRDAENMLQQIIEGNLDPKTFVTSSSPKTYLLFVTFLASKDANSAFRILNTLDEDGVDISMWTLGFLGFLRELMFTKVLQSSGAEHVLDFSEDVMADIEELLPRISIKTLNNFVENFLKAHNDIGNSPIALLPVELAVVNTIFAEGWSLGESSRSKVDTDGDESGNGDSRGGESKGGEDDVSSEDDRGATRKSRKGDDADMEEDFGGEIDKLLQPSNNKLGKSGKDLGGKKRGEDHEEEGLEGEDSEDDLATAIAVSIEDIVKSWKTVVRESEKYNNSVHALLKASVPISVSGRDLLLEVKYKFHKERLETSKNKEIVRTVMKEVFGTALNPKCSIRERDKSSSRDFQDLTDYNVVVPSGSKKGPSFDVSDPKSIADVFDGALPL